MHNLSYKEELEGNTKHSTAAYIKVREDASTGLTYKLPLEGGYARSLVNTYHYHHTLPKLLSWKSNLCNPYM
ncbi:palindromic element RPE1 domain-containing protein [Rickettsia rhipicephali]|nr:palindromic element RPE1 domain-containing protein [Rickettsia rhipicephali]